MASHFGFDQVATRYSRQRATPPEVAAAIGQAIAAQVGPQASLLEIGVGTGLIAWPVVAAGCRVVGLDLSRGMLAEVAGQRPAAVSAPLPLVQADMHDLPWADASFAGVLMVRTLHLAHDWRQVLAECVRVLRPDGVLLLGRIWVDPTSAPGQIRQEMRRYVMDNAPSLTPPAAGAAVGQFLAGYGARPPQELTAAEWTTQESPVHLLDTIAARADNESWVLDETLVAGLMAHLRPWAAAKWPDLAAPQPTLHRFLLQTIRGNWGAPQNV